MLEGVGRSLLKEGGVCVRVRVCGVGGACVWCARTRVRAVSSSYTRGRVYQRVTRCASFMSACRAYWTAST